MKARIVRTGIAVAVTSLVTAGATWHVAAEENQTQTGKANVQVLPAPALGQVNRTSYADIVRLVAPAVVTIRTEGNAQIAPAAFPEDEFFRRFFGDQYDQGQPRTFRQRALGSGVIVSTDGYILTNHHVIAGADDIRVDLADGRTLEATVVGTDAPSDLALLKIGATDLHPLQLGDSNAVQVGDVVLALGNPLGVGQTVTMGIISAKGRATTVGDEAYEDFLQTDAPINQGNSGGALVNTGGQLVGINSQILSPSGGNIGIGFAIPANMAKHVMESLRKDGRVRRAALGVSVQPLTSELSANLGVKDTEGAVVATVTPGSPADRAGVKPNDVITAFNGDPVHDMNALRNRVAESAPGSRATMTVRRGGSEQRLSVELAEVPQVRPTT